MVIYALTSPSEAAYIGCTANPRKRFREHRCLLRKGIHKSKNLQAAWDDHGEDGFEMIELETCEREVKREREQFWMDIYAQRGHFLNENPIAGAPPPGAQAKAAAARVANGFRPSAESNKKRSEAQLGIPRKRATLGA